MNRLNHLTATLVVPLLALPLLGLDCGRDKLYSTLEYEPNDTNEEAGENNMDDFFGEVDLYTGVLLPDQNDTNDIWFLTTGFLDEDNDMTMTASAQNLPLPSSGHACVRVELKKCRVDMFEDDLEYWEECPGSERVTIGTIRTCNGNGNPITEQLDYEIQWDRMLRAEVTPMGQSDDVNVGYELTFTSAER